MLKYNVVAGIVLCGLLFTTVGSAEARSVVRTGETVTIADDQTAEGDLYGAGYTVVQSGGVTGDAHLVGGRVNLSGVVATDTLALGLTVDVSGKVGDDLRIVGGDVTVSGEVAGDLFVIARTLNVLSQARIAGDVIFFGQEGTIDGAVGNDVVGRMTSLRLDGPVGGAVNVETNNLTLGDGAAIAGNLEYKSSDDLTRAPQAVVEGEVVRSTAAPVDVRTNAETALGVLLLVLFAVLSWYVFLRRSLEEVVRRGTDHPLRSGLVGLALLFVAPFLAGVLVVSQLGLLVGLVVGVVYLLLLVLAAVLLPALVGGFLVRQLLPRSGLSVWWILLGSIIVAALFLMPPILAVIPLTLLMISLGALSERMYDVLKKG